MIQADDRVQGPVRQGRAVEPVDPGPPLRSRTGPPAADPADDEQIFFVSPPPAPFPRVLPGL